MINKEKPIFNFYPANGHPIGIVSIPHSGENIPSEISNYLSNNLKDLMRDVDYKVNELVDIKKLNEAGISVIYSNVIRTAVDLNRARDIAALNWKKNTQGKEIVIKAPKGDELELFTQKYYDPYYEMLYSLVKELKTTHPKASFVDLHSMPSRPTAYHLNINPDQKMHRPDFCISDRHQKSCERPFIDYICNDLASYNYEVSQNDPYIGGNVTGHINEVFPDINNIQIEINRAIYMDEENQSLNIKSCTKLSEELTQCLINLFVKFSNA